MSARAAPDVPEYRVTLFYGPETAPEPPHDRHCVFNVKKRSWKGGVQMDVWISETQLAALTSALRFDAWLDRSLAALDEHERPSYRDRAHDLLVQQLCHAKLEHAIARGVAQQNARIDPASHAADLARSLPRREAELRRAILAELDLPDLHP